MITTLAAILANVYRTKTDNVITPSQQIITDWNAAISAAIASQDATIASAVATQNAQISDLKSEINAIFSAENSFDKTTITEGYVINLSTGNRKSLSGCFYSDPIDVGEAKYVIININLGSNQYGHAFYDDTFTYITPGIPSYGYGSDGTGVLVFAVPDNAKYLRISGETAKKDDIKVVIITDAGKVQSVLDSVGFCIVNQICISPTSALFTVDDMPVGSKLYYDFVLTDNHATFLELLDSNDQRILFIGKGSSSSGDMAYSGSIEIPSGFSYAKFSGYAQNITVNYLAKLTNNIILANNVDSINESIVNNIGTVMPGIFVSIDGSNRCLYFSVSGSKCAICDVTRIVGKKVRIITTQVSTTYKLLYVFADENGQMVSMYNGDERLAQTLDKNVTVPSTAKLLYVNCNSENNVSIVTSDSHELITYQSYSAKGKSIVTYGDSLTWYDTQQFTWGTDEGTPCIGFQTYLRTVVGMQTTNRGESGKTTPQICTKIRNAEDLDDFDYMTIMGGNNDDRLDVTIGSLQPVGGTFDTTTIYGALQSAIEYALTENPALRIVLMTEPMGFTYQNNTLDRVSDLIPNAYRRVAELYGLPLIDLWAKSGINELTRAEYYLDPSTGNTDYMYHPNNKGWNLLSKIICSEIVNY